MLSSKGSSLRTRSVIRTVELKELTPMSIQDNIRPQCWHWGCLPRCQTSDSSCCTTVSPLDLLPCATVHRIFRKLRELNHSQIFEWQFSKKLYRTGANSGGFFRSFKQPHLGGFSLGKQNVPPLIPSIAHLPNIMFLLRTVEPLPLLKETAGWKK